MTTEVVSLLPLAALAPFADSVRAALRARGWSAYRLAEAARVPPSAALCLVRPRFGDPPTIRADHVQRLAKAIGLEFRPPTVRQVGTGAPLFPCRCGRFGEHHGLCTICRAAEDA
jgi:hypothetical protein